MRLGVVCLAIGMMGGCGSKQGKVETEPETVEQVVEAKSEPVEPVKPPTEEEQAERARQQVLDFLDAVRSERYEEAYEASSFMLKNVYTFDQFLMIAGKLEMEEMPCIADEDVAAMEQTSGNVGIGPKDVDVEGFLIRYSCDGQDRILFIYLDWGGEWTSPGGVASIWWREAPPE